GAARGWTILIGQCRSTWQPPACRAGPASRTYGRAMRIAVVTPYADQPVEWLRQGHDSVRRQGVDATHFLVADGCPDPAVAAWADQHIVLKHRHGDGGNAARMAGGLSAASQRFDAITFLDAADWFLPGHLA